MLTFYAISAIKFIHILSAAIWFGSKFLVPVDIRRAIADGGSPLDAAIRRINLAQKVVITTATITLASGIAIIFMYGGFAAVPPRIHAGFVLTLVLFALGAFAVDKVWARIRDAVKRGEGRAELDRLERLFSRLMTLENILWCVVLFLMVFPVEALP